jgi:hypothetical protein
MTKLILQYTSLSFKQYGIISCVAFIAGLLFFCIYHDIIIIRLLIKQTVKNELSITQTTIKKRAKLIYWHDAKWHTQEKELLESQDTIKTITYLLASWLSLMQTEQIIEKNITIQTILLDKSGHELYISFDKNFLPKKSSLRAKVLLIESLLKTIRAHTNTITSIRLLVRHKTLIDPHLDFSRSWSTNGFLA